MLTGTNLKYTRAHNLRIVLEAIRLFGPLSRKEIAQRTELRFQTVSNITRKLLDANLILETDRLQKGRGAPTALFNLNAQGAFSIGLDFDREHFTVVLVDFLGNVCQRVSYSVLSPMPEEAIALMVDSVNELIRRQGANKEHIWGIGVGLPGPLGISEGSVVTNVANPSAFPGWDNVPIADILSRRLGLPVFIENNASAAAAGERWYGRGRHIKNFFHLFFGVGLGGGLVLNGRPYDGHNGNAGEIGAIPTTSGYHTATGLVNPHMGAFFSLPVLSELLKPEGIDISHPEELGDLFEQKHKVLLDWLEEGIAQLAPFILAVECLIDPEAIFLGGRYPEPVIRYIKDRLEEAVPVLRFEKRMAHPHLYCATAGEDATALGVATLPMYSSFAPIPEVLMKHPSNASGEHIASLHI